MPENSTSNTLEKDNSSSTLLEDSSREGMESPDRTSTESTAPSMALKDFEREFNMRMKQRKSLEDDVRRQVEKINQVHLWKLPDNVRSMKLSDYMEQLQRGGIKGEGKSVFPLYSAMNAMMPPPPPPSKSRLVNRPNTGTKKQLKSKKTPASGKALKSANDIGDSDAASTDSSQGNGEGPPKEACTTGSKNKRVSTRKTKNPYCTPLNKPNTEAIIRPKVDPNAAVPLSRRPRPGEVTFSKHGSPVTMEDSMDGSLQVKLASGMVLTIPAKDQTQGQAQGRSRMAIDGLDEDVRSGLATLKKQLDVFMV